MNFSMMGLGFHFFVKDEASLGIEKIDRAMKNLTVDAETMYYSTKKALDDLKPKFGALGDERVQAALRGTGIALMGMGTAGTLATGMAVKSFGDFEQQMLNARSVAGWTEKQYQELSKYAIQVGADTKFSAKEAAEAIYEISSAGVSASKDVKALLRPIADFAAAGAIQLPEATRAIVAAVQGFKMSMGDAGHIADVFTAAVQNSMLKAEEFDVALGSVAGVAGQVGQSVEAAMSGLMAARNVIGSAQDAATSLRSAMMHLIAPTNESANIMSVLGVQLRDSQGRMKAWPDVIREFQASFAGAGELVKQFGSFAGASDEQLKALADTYGLTKEQALGLAQAASQGTQAFQDYVLATVFGTDGIRAVAAGLNAQAKVMKDGKEIVLTGADALEYWQTKLENSEGAAQKAAKVQMSGFNGAMEQLRGSVEAAGLSLGNILAPSVIKIADLANKAVDVFTKMPAWLQKTVAWGVAGGSALALIGGALLIGISMIPSFVQGLAILKTTWLGVKLAALGARAATLAHATASLVVRGATLAWTAAQWGLNAALSANPIGIIILAIAGLVAGIVLLVKHWDAVKAGLSRVGEAVKKFFVHDVPYYIGYGVGFLVRAISTGIAAAVRWITHLPETVATKVTDMISYLREEGPRLYQNAVSAGHRIVSGIENAIVNLPATVKEAIEKAILKIKQAAIDFWNAGKQVAGNLWKGFKEGLGIKSPSYIEKALTNIVTASRGAVKDLGRSFSQISNLRAEPVIATRAEVSGGSMAPVRSATPGARAASPPILTVTRKETKQVTNEQVRTVTRQPIKLVLDGRTIAETVIEFIEDAQTRRVVTA